MEGGELSGLKFEVPSSLESLLSCNMVPHELAGECI